MKKVGSKVPVEQQRVELPDDLTIPDFLRRSMPATPAQHETGQQSALSPSVT